MSFVKLHGTILDSSIWSEPHPTRIVWITLLAMADQDGVVQASMDGLAHRARVTLQEATDAIATFHAPDPYSRDRTTGERVEDVPGGWLVLNHSNYREQRTKEQIATAIRVARHRLKRKLPVTKRYNSKVTPGNANSPSDTEADTDAESPPEVSTPPTGRKRAPRAAASPPPLPAALATDEIGKALDAYQAARREQGHRQLGPVGLAQLYAKLDGWGPERALAALQHSTANGYQGVFEEKGNRTAAPTDKPKPIDWKAMGVEIIPSRS